MFTLAKPVYKTWNNLPGDTVGVIAGKMGTSESCYKNEMRSCSGLLVQCLRGDILNQLQLTGLF